MHERRMTASHGRGQGAARPLLAPLLAPLVTALLAPVLAAASPGAGWPATGTEGAARTFAVQAEPLLLPAALRRLPVPLSGSVSVPVSVPVSGHVSGPVLVPVPGPAPAAAGPADTAAALADARLDDLRGGTETPWSDMRLDGTVGGNTAVNVVSGANHITDGAFSNASGLPMVIQNSGSNVLIQNATIVNVQIR